jgi:hypothetical protein
MQSTSFAIQNYDRLVIDIDYFFELDGSVIVARVKLLTMLYEFFDLVLWEEKSILKHFGYIRKKRLLSYGELDFLDYLCTSKRDLREWLRMNKSTVVTTNPELLQYLGHFACREFAAGDIISAFYRPCR